jgi:hypothetical protein
MGKNVCRDVTVKIEAGVIRQQTAARETSREDRQTLATKAGKYGYSEEHEAQRREFRRGVTAKRNSG